MHPFSILLFLFLAIPLIEIYLLVKVGGIIGALPTVVLVVFTAVLGVWLLRIQGLSTLQRVRESMAAGRVPALEMLEGLILLIAGALLLTPGFFTDTIGFLCLLPALRRAFLVWVLQKWTIQAAARATATSYTDTQSGPTRDEHLGGQRQHSKRTSTQKQHNLIEGEFRRDDD